MPGKAIFFGIILVLIVSGGVFGSDQHGTLTLHQPEPAILQVFHPNTWSYRATWDLKDKKSIPCDAVVTFVRMEWEVLTQGGIGGLVVGLNTRVEEEEEKQEHLFFLNKSSTEKFSGVDPKQIWEVRFRVSYWERKGLPLQLTVKRLVIGWEVPGD